MYSSLSYDSRQFTRIFLWVSKPPQPLMCESYRELGQLEFMWWWGVPQMTHEEEGDDHALLTQVKLFGGSSEARKTSLSLA